VCGTFSRSCVLLFSSFHPPGSLRAWSGRLFDAMGMGWGWSTFRDVVNGVNAPSGYRAKIVLSFSIDRNGRTDSLHECPIDDFEHFLVP
jgi:hypothetical protein